VIDKDEQIVGVYSSVKSAYRDGVKLCNQTNSQVQYLNEEGQLNKITLGAVRIYFKDKTEGVLRMSSGHRVVVKILKCPFLN
tara:strand:+ start:165 stop:410 length:246 start_codon:yes stop_codon:yes gene_type:complete